MIIPTEGSCFNENSEESLPRQAVKQESDEAVNYESFADTGELKDENELITDETEDNIATVEEVKEEIKRVFEEDKKLMTKLIKLAEANIYGFTQEREICGLKPDDIVMNSIEDILEGRRKWKKDKCPNIVVLIIGAIKSNVSNLLNSKEYKFNQKVIPIQQNDDENQEEINLYDNEIGKRYSPNEIKNDTDEEEFFQKILDLFSDDEEAYCVLHEIIYGLDYDVKEQNQLLAKRLGISVTDVENAKKRIKYKLLFLKKGSKHRG
uniref:Uncharacterized protein n=1 Tax=Ignavibacterium album TaxID=591197 RepID=A0A832G250_9BACT